MQLVKLTTLLCILFTTILPASAHSVVNLTVPFTNFFLNPNGVIQANFSFGPFSTIFCYENNLQTIGIITWPFQGQRFTSTLPIFLKTQASAQGSFSDPNGTLTITNNQTFTLVVSCNLAF
jgi:hypothetical protein